MTMVAKLLDVEPKTIPAGRSGPLTARWVVQMAQAEQAARNEDAQAVWIIRKPNLTDRVVQRISWPSRRVGYLVLIGTPRLEVLPALAGRFERVAFVSPGGVLPKQELETVLKSPERRDRFVGGIVDSDAKIVTLWRGDFEALVVPFSGFPATANGIHPDWEHFTVTDYGHTLRFGDYEAAADAILYDYDPEFRRRQNKRRRAAERTMGASIRRLRKQRQLTRNDFRALDPKTLARIERSEVQKPHQDTLKLIADRLGVSSDDLGSY
jgi:hypothetical protein